MKVNTLGKYKWYLIAIIAAVLIMSIGLSFCIWDTTSFATKPGDMSGKTANYKPYDLVGDNFKDDNGSAGANNIANVGDIVTFGNYYQSAEATDKNLIKAPIRWIVVDKAPNATSGAQELTLLAESVMAFGNFWNRYYHNGALWGWEDKGYALYYQNYMVSTLSKWLNSDYGARSDKGTAFSATANKLSMRGFMNEAFTADEQAYINSRTISGIKGMAAGISTTAVSDYGSESYKVWVPSWTEIYGVVSYEGKPVLDGGSGNTQFLYFENNTDNSLKIGKTTAFASTPAKSNYTTMWGVVDTQPHTQETLIISQNKLQEPPKS